MKKNELDPYPECEHCQDLLDCKHVDVLRDGLGSPMPPDNCKRAVEIMKLTYKKHKRYDRPIDRDA